MAPSKRSKIDDDPTRDDSSDEDFNDHAPRSPRNSKRSRPKSGSHRTKPPKKRQRRRSDDSDIVDDDDVSSEESWSDEREEEEAIELNPDTNRPVRRAAKAQQTYEESDASAEKFESSGSDSDQDIKEENIASPIKRGSRLTNQQRITQGRRGASAQLASHQPSPIKSAVGRRTTRLGSRALSIDPQKPSKIITLQLDPGYLRKFTDNNNIIASSRQSSVRPARSRAASSASATAIATRRTRASPVPEELYELNAQGLPVVTSSSQSMAGSRPTTANANRPNLSHAHTTFAGKSLKKPSGKFPSTIMEDSQEKSQSRAIQLSDEEEEEDDAPQITHVADTRENSPADAEGEEDDEDDGPIASNRRGSRRANVLVNVEDSDDENVQVDTSMTAQHATKRPRASQTQGRSSQKRKRTDDEDDDFDPEGNSSDGHNMSDDQHQPKKVRTASSQNSTGRALRSRRNSNTDDDIDIDEDELQEEAFDLTSAKPRRQLRRRATTSPAADSQPRKRALRKSQYKEGQYGILGHAHDAFLDPNFMDDIETDPVGKRTTQDAAAGYNGALSRRKGKVGAWAAATNTAGVFGGGNDRNLAGGLDTDSSDDEATNLPLTSPRTGQTKKKAAGFAEDFGRIDAAANDALGVNAHLGFGSVGGLDQNIQQLQDMIVLPLMYPQMYGKSGLKPPRGVLFHGPPGTGKTSLARAVAANMSKGKTKVTFFMRKGADVLSKYVGEAERQLKALFDEAKKCQPSIIFFDEIDGLAPQRKSSSEQIHNTIVACLLSHMDGLDDRGQVIIIGATNRPDQVDEALRRPGRFDRELYFPLPDVKGRRTILDIHTKRFDPPVADELKDQLAMMTKGCSGADIEALCRDATLASIQRTFPQIYKSDEKLEVDINQIQVKPKDFLLVMDSLIPSSERAAATASKPKKTRVEPLIKRAVDDVIKLVGDIMPQKRKTTALEEAMFDDHDDPMALEFWELEKIFREARVHRPRLLISGLRGMGQPYLATAVVAKFESLHLQSFDLPTLLEDSSRSPEATIVQLFKEVRRHKPAIIFIPNVSTWWETLDHRTARLFTQMLQGLDANDEIMVLGIMALDSDEDRPDPVMMRDLFGFSSKSEYKIQRPDIDARREFFQGITAYISRSPAQLPQPENRKPRHLPELPLAPVEIQEVAAYSEAELKQSLQKDLYLLNQMKARLRPILASIKQVYRNLAQSAFDLNNVPYSGDQAMVTTDYTWEQLKARAANGDNVPSLVPTTDKHGVNGVLHVESGHIFYNISTHTIDARVENGAYYHPDEFQADIHRMISDFIHIHLVVENPRQTAASDLNATVSTDLFALSIEDPNWAEYSKIRDRFRLRKELQAKKALAKRAEEKKKQQDDVQARRTSSHNNSPIRLMSPPKRGRSSRQPSRSRSPVNNFPVASGAVQPLNPSAMLASMAAHATPVRQVANTSSQENAPLTQSSFVQKIAPGRSVADYYNSASTTTSGQKTSQSNGSARQGDPDFSGLHDMMSGGSQIPDTQPGSGTSGSTQSRNTQPNKLTAVSFDDSIEGSQQRSPDKDGFRPPPLPSNINTPSRTNTMTNPPTTAVSALLNPVSPDKSQPQPTLILDRQHLALFLDEVVRGTSGLSIEQLEQVYATLMSTIWRHKGDWNRTEVTQACTVAFNEIIQDIEGMQKVLMSSLEAEERRRLVVEEEEQQQRRAMRG